MTRVRCSVDSCDFWGEGEVCQADSIWVKNNMIGDTDNELSYGFNTEISNDLTIPENEGGDVIKPTSAKTSHHTCCETMRPRRQG
ncbi:MAG: DUF1540 domain-containing protein [Bacillota bacterium]|nr:DUF1540 domain-containing protein [Bacillota bacterium]